MRSSEGGKNMLFTFYYFAQMFAIKKRQIFIVKLLVILEVMAIN